MTQKSRRKLRLWQELKRRGVPRVLAMYAATAFIVIEASDIIFPRLGLPDWSVTLMIILLIIGFPVTFVLSWIFDITPQGVIKTGPIDELDESGEPEKVRRRKLRTSDGVIALLLIIVIVLAFPKIFGDGDSQLRRKMPQQISIAVMPFKNLTGDTLFNLWQGGMQNLIITSLSNSEELSVRQFETMNSLLNNNDDLNFAGITPSMAGEMARKVEANTVIVGNLHKSGTKMRVTANIMNTETEEIYKSYEMEGQGEDELFDLADSLSSILKDFLEISNIKQRVVPYMADVFTSSSEAYKYYLQGYSCHNRMDYSCAADYYQKAIKVDSNFVSAMVQLAYCYADQRQAEQSKYWAYQAFERIDHLPLDMKLKIQVVKAVADKNPLPQLEYIRQYLEHRPHSSYMVYMEGWTNYNLERWEEAVEGFERSMNIMKKMDLPSWAWTYILLGGAYHKMGIHNKEQKIFEDGREFWPEHSATFDYWQAVCAVSQGDSVKAYDHLNEIRKVLEQRGWPEANVLSWYAGVHNLGESFVSAESYYRKVQSLKPNDDWLNADLSKFLITNDINLDEGMELISPLVQKYPENASFAYVHALGLFKQGNYQLAYEEVERSWDLTPYYDHKQFLLREELEEILFSN